MRRALLPLALLVLSLLFPPYAAADGGWSPTLGGFGGERTSAAEREQDSVRPAPPASPAALLGSLGGSLAGALPSPGPTGAESPRVSAPEEDRFPFALRLHSARSRIRTLQLAYLGFAPELARPRLGAHGFYSSAPPPAA
jgi:hypothetical protein